MLKRFSRASVHCITGDISRRGTGFGGNLNWPLLKQAIWFHVPYIFSNSVIYSPVIKNTIFVFLAFEPLKYFIPGGRNLHFRQTLLTHSTHGRQGVSSVRREIISQCFKKQLWSCLWNMDAGVRCDSRKHGQPCSQRALAGNAWQLTLCAAAMFNSSPWMFDWFPSRWVGDSRCHRVMELEGLLWQ